MKRVSVLAESLNSLKLRTPNPGGPCEVRGKQQPLEA